MGEFGEYIMNKRKDMKMTLRGFAKKLGVSPSYVSDIENGNREPNGSELLDSLVRALELDEIEAEKMYDLAAAQRNEIAQDVSRYVNENNMAKVALRTARSYGATDEDWKRFIDEVKGKGTSDENS